MKRMLMLFFVGLSFAAPVLAMDQVGDIQEADDSVKPTLECAAMKAREVPANLPVIQKQEAPAKAVAQNAE